MPARKRIVYKRSGSPFWHYRWFIDGRDIHGSTRTVEKATAERIALKVREDALIEIRLGAAADKRRVTVEEAFKRFWQEYAEHLSYAKTTQYTIATVREGIGPEKFLDTITDDDLARYVATRRSKVSNATVNRELAQFGAMNKRARELWDVKASPARAAKHGLPEASPRTRYLDRASEAERLIGTCAEHLRPVVVAALATGLRRGNLLGLDWSQVDMRARLITVQVKDRRPGGKVLSIPIIPHLLAELAAIKGRRKGRVFKRYGKPIDSIKTAFNAACRRAKIKDFRFHDLRHTAASWMVQAGVPLDLVQKILGHAEIRTTQRYAHRQADAVRQAMESSLGTGHGQHNGLFSIPGGKEAKDA